MKQLLLLLVISVFSTSIFAQLNKGQWLVGGSAGFSYVKQDYAAAYGADGYKQTTEELAPAVGYFIIDKLSVGLRTSIGFGQNTGYNNLVNGGLNYKSNTTLYSVAPFIRYYFLPKANKINLLADVSYAYFNSRNKEWSDGIYQGTSKDHWYSYTVAAGPAFFINPKTALEVTAGYTFKNDRVFYSKTNTVMVNVGFQIYLGGKKA